GRRSARPGASRAECRSAGPGRPGSASGQPAARPGGGALGGAGRRGRGGRGGGGGGGACGGGGGGGGGAGMGCEATLHSREAASYFRPMGFWRRLFGGSGADEINPQRLDYLNEALALERQGDYDSALTSYRLALRDHPNDARILQNMAIAFTKTRRIDEAIR